jgi:hypothetical protein
MVVFQNNNKITLIIIIIIITWQNGEGVFTERESEIEIYLADAYCFAVNFQLCFRVWKQLVIFAPFRSLPVLFAHRSGVWGVNQEALGKHSETVAECAEAHHHFNLYWHDTWKSIKKWILKKHAQVLGGEMGPEPCFCHSLRNVRRSEESLPSVALSKAHTWLQPYNI